MGALRENVRVERESHKLWLGILCPTTQPAFAPESTHGLAFPRRP
jgi:hypothetical protein